MMVLNTVKCNCLTPLHFKGLILYCYYLLTRRSFYHQCLCPWTGLCSFQAIFI